MKMQPVTSSNIKAVGWEAGTLRIEFNSGGAYDYPDVAHVDYMDLLQAESVGKHFHKMGIKSKGVKINGGA